MWSKSKNQKLDPKTSAVLKPRHNQLYRPCITDNVSNIYYQSHTYTIKHYTTSFISQHTIQVLNKYPMYQTYIFPCLVHSLWEKLVSCFIHLHVFTYEVSKSCISNTSGEMGTMPRDMFSYYCAMILYIFGIYKLIRTLVATIYKLHMDEKVQNNP